MQDSEEKSLLEKSRKGDPKAFEALVKKHEPKIYNLLLSMTNNEAEAADLFQETFLAAWRNLRSFKGRSSFSTWLYRIAVNLVLMKRRKKKVPTVSMDVPIYADGEEVQRDFAGDWSENPLATLENRELKEYLYRTIGGLPEKYKTVLVLSDIQGLKNEEIKKILKISLPSVKSRIHRGRLLLRNQLSGYFKKP